LHARMRAVLILVLKSTSPPLLIELLLPSGAA
jgi:hypothetical protein